MPQPRRRLRYQVAASLDGFIAGPNGEYDWIPMDPDIDFGALFAQFDTLVMGRLTYDVTRAQEGGATDQGLYGMKTYVCSRTLAQAAHPGVTIVSDGIEQAVAELKALPGKDIWLFGGGQLFRQLAQAGLVDAVEVALIPVLLGEGIPLLPPPATRVRLSLTTHRVYEKSGTVMLEYAVTR